MKDSIEWNVKVVTSACIRRYKDRDGQIHACLLDHGHDGLHVERKMESAVIEFSWNDTACEK